MSKLAGPMSLDDNRHRISKMALQGNKKSGKGAQRHNPLPAARNALTTVASVSFNFADE